MTTDLSLGCCIKGNWHHFHIIKDPLMIFSIKLKQLQVSTPACAKPAGKSHACTTQITSQICRQRSSLLSPSCSFRAPSSRGVLAKAQASCRIPKTGASWVGWIATLYCSITLAHSLQSLLSLVERQREGKADL